MTVLLLTRPESQGRAFLAELEAAAGRPLPAVLSPLLRIEALPWRPARPYGTALVTSANALPALAALPGVPVLAVGPRTAALARESGHEAMEGGGDVEALLATALSLHPPGPLVHLRGEVSRGDLARRLTGAGLPTDEAVVYRQTAMPPTAAARTLLDGTAPVLAPVFSPRTAALLAAHGPVRAPLHLVAISEAVAEALAPLAAESVTVAASPDGAATVAACLARLKLLESP